MKNLKRFLFRKAFPRLQTHQPLPENPPLPEASSGQSPNERAAPALPLTQGHSVSFSGYRPQHVGPQGHKHGSDTDTPTPTPLLFSQSCSPRALGTTQLWLLEFEFRPPQLAEHLWASDLTSLSLCFVSFETSFKWYSTGGASHGVTTIGWYCTRSLALCL